MWGYLHGTRERAPDYYFISAWDQHITVLAHKPFIYIRPAKKSQQFGGLVLVMDHHSFLVFCMLKPTFYTKPNCHPALLFPNPTMPKTNRQVECGEIIEREPSKLAVGEECLNTAKQLSIPPLWSHTKLLSFHGVLKYIMNCNFCIPSRTISLMFPDVGCGDYK